MVRPEGFESTVYFCLDEVAPTLAISKLVFELSAILISNLSLVETLPTALAKRITDINIEFQRFYSVELNITCELS